MSSYESFLDSNSIWAIHSDDARYVSVKSHEFVCFLSSLSSKSKAGSYPIKNPAFIETIISLIGIPASTKAKVAAFIAADLEDPSFSTTHICRSIYDLIAFLSKITFSKIDLIIAHCSWFFWVHFKLAVPLCSGIE